MTETGLVLQTAARGARASSRIKFVLGGVVILAVVAWLIFSNIGASSAYYMSVGELVAAGSGNRIVRAAGLVVDQSIRWDPQAMVLQFELEDESGRMAVVYRGPRPDMFRDGAQAVIEGKYGAAGAFEATSLLLKCPSKYAEE